LKRYNIFFLSHASDYEKRHLKRGNTFILHGRGNCGSWTDSSFEMKLMDNPKEFYMQTFRNDAGRNNTVL